MNFKGVGNDDGIHNASHRPTFFFLFLYLFFFFFFLKILTFFLVVAPVNLHVEDDCVK
jgi:hypothetical protein